MVDGTVTESRSYVVLQVYRNAKSWNVEVVVL